MPRIGKNGPKRLTMYGAWLRFLRKERNLTQMELAQMTGLTQRTISDWENEGTITGRTQILAMCEALHVKPEVLLKVKD